MKLTGIIAIHSCVGKSSVALWLNRDNNVPRFYRHISNLLMQEHGLSYGRHDMNGVVGLDADHVTIDSYILDLMRASDITWK